MAMAISTGFGRHGVQSKTPGKGLAQRLAARFSAYLARERELSELAGMTDRELNDMGIGRSDIPAIAAGTFRRGA